MPATITSLASRQGKPPPKNHRTTHNGTTHSCASHVHQAPFIVRRAPRDPCCISWSEIQEEKRDNLVVMPPILLSGNRRAPQCREAISASDLEQMAGSSCRTQMYTAPYTQVKVEGRSSSMSFVNWMRVASRTST